MNSSLFKIIALSECLAITLCRASTQTNDPRHAVQLLLQSQRSPNLSTNDWLTVPSLPLYRTDRDGYVCNLMAAPSNFFPVMSVVTGHPEQTARHFIAEQAAALGVKSPHVAFNLKKSKPSMGGQVARFKQTYQDIPVFGSDVIIKMNPSGGIQYLLSHILKDTDAFDQGNLSTHPYLSAKEATESIRTSYRKGKRNVDLAFTTPQLKIFVPALHGFEGPARLVWEFRVSSVQCDECNRKILLDANNGEIVRAYPLQLTGLSRAIYDANNTFNSPTGVTPPCGIVDADMVWNHLADAYNYYAIHFGRDAIDDDGSWIKATVRYCKPANPCPYNNAFWSGNDEQLYFGDGYCVDDIVGHEYTHGVSYYTADFAYENESGALSESFSDVFGEYIDWSNGTGNDAPTNRWFIGEDMAGGAMRYMRDPTRNGDPDRYFSTNRAPYSSDPQEANDWGGVHSNNGINNKLCYLLTDGDFFNGQFVSGIGENLVGKAYYEALDYLGELSGYYELYVALLQATYGYAWTHTQRNNFYRACKAVEIASNERDIWVDKSYPYSNSDGTQYRPFTNVNDGMLYADPGDRMIIVSNVYNSTGTYDLIMEVMATQGVVTIGITNMLLYKSSAEDPLKP